MMSLRAPLRTGCFFVACACWIAAACGSDDSSNDSTIPDAGNDAAFSSDAAAPSDASKDDSGPSVPTHQAAGLSFDDKDPTQGSVGGQVTIKHAADESDVTSYVLYWGNTLTARTQKIVELAKTGSDLSYDLTGSVPGSASFLLVFTENAAGEMDQGVGLGDADHYPIFVPNVIDAGSGQSPQTSMVVDSINHKLLLVTVADFAPYLFRCELDGTGCVESALVTSSPPNIPGGISTLIDAANGKLLIIAQNFGTGAPGLVRCNLDGTSCSFSDLAAGQGTGSGENPSAVIDTVNSKLLVATNDQQNGSIGTIGFFRCNLDGTSCTFINLSQLAGQGSSSYLPQPIIDTVNGKLLVVAMNYSSLDVFRCSLDGTGCTFTDVGAKLDAGLAPAASMSVALDLVTEHLLVATSDDSTGRIAALFRCSLDLTTCTTRVLSPGVTLGYDTQVTVAVDPIDQQSWTAYTDMNRISYLNRCPLDAGACTAYPLSTTTINIAIQGVIDSADHRLILDTYGNLTYLDL